MKSTLIVASVLAMTGVAQAAIVVTHEYRFEESGKIDGSAIDTILNSVNTAVSPMTKQSGAPTYSNVVGSAPPAVIASTLSGNFTGGGRVDSTNGGQWGTQTDNFGMDVWVRPGGDTGFQPIMVNGYSNANGIVQDGGEYRIVLKDATYDLGDAAITGVGQWDHLALVRDNGVTTLYLNGVSVGTTNADAGTANNHSFIGGSVGTVNGSFLGYVDTARYFTFTAGQFAVSDLNVVVPEPAAVSLLGLAGMTLLRRRRA